MITEDYVSFETAKLLKEKGFDEAVLITDWWCDAEGQMYKRGNYSYSGAPFYDKEICFNCPTLQMAMKWLRKEKGIDILFDVSAWRTYDWYYIFEGNRYHYEEMSFEYSNLEDAVDDAIKYCLENLI